MPRAVVMNLLRPSGPYISRVGLGTASGSTPLPKHILDILYNNDPVQSAGRKNLHCINMYFSWEKNGSMCEISNETDLNRTAPIPMLTAVFLN